MNKYTKSGPTTKFENKVIDEMSQDDLYAKVPTGVGMTDVSNDEEKIDPFATKKLPHEQTKKIPGYKNLSKEQKIQVTENRADTTSNI